MKLSSLRIVTVYRHRHSPLNSTCARAHRRASPSEALIRINREPGPQTDISVSDSTVTIKGESRHEEKKEDGEYFRSEITRGAFSRTVALPTDVDASKARASFGNGMLNLQLPKKQKAKRVKVSVE